MKISGEKIKQTVSSVKEHWSTPPEGRYIPYKEILAYSVGGIGVKFVIYTVWYISLSATSLLAGSALGLKNGDLVKLNMIATIIGLFLGPIRGLIIDNTRSSKGKFRPYLLYTGIPSAILLTIFAFLPFETMTYNQKLWSLFISYMLLQLCYPFYDQAYTTLVQVMSPNSTERADVITVSTFIYSLAPTIMGFFVPLIAGFTGGLEHINAYRVIMPALGIGGALIGLFSYFGTKERIIVSKDYTPKVPFFKGIGAGIANKYQWARSLTSWCILLQAGVGNVTTWYFYYGIKDVLNLSTEQQGALNGTLMTILGAAATPAMLLSPLLIRKFGKRNMYIFYILGNVITLVGMYLFVEQIWVLYACIWIRGFFNTFPLIADSAMSADVLDYQQYKSGDRLEGLMGQFVGTIGVFVSMGITYFTQTIVMQNHFGLVDNYDDLYKASFREPISKGMILIALVGFVLALIPFVTMYTLTEEEHESHIKVLKIRAALEDYATDSLSEGQLDEAKKIYADSVNEYNECIEALNSASNRKERKKLQSKIKALEIVIDEKDRFATEKMLKKTAKANELLTHTVEELYGISEPTLDKYNEANAMSENTKEEANLKATKLKEASKELDIFHKKAYDYIQARKLIKQKEYYANWDKIFVDEPELQEV
ncbi:MFS transporter [Eubacterium coprostanoligenes]|uniref:MFS transporter n=1 Tax=Eubacterium coprostanoligenes TaxID=290054 RepID=UPI002356A40F|nr:MFS transporter [Eubacterium coprostanoligenes]MCI6353799.1 MFS transporter [Eubacterium coprostanoligenes]